MLNAIKKVKIEMTGIRHVDESLANNAAGFTTRPEGYTWHHHHDGQTMMLVPEQLHKHVKHTGGARFIREVNVGRIIGTDKFKDFQPTSTITIMTDNYGNLITATPGNWKVN